MKVPDKLIDELRRAEAGETVAKPEDKRPFLVRLFSSIRIAIRKPNEFWMKGGADF